MRTLASLVLAAALGLVVPGVAHAGPTVRSVEGHPTFIVDSVPFLNLSVHLQESAAIELDRLPLETYVDTAHALGFTAVRALVRWETWEDGLPPSGISTNSLSRAQLEDLVTAARRRGLKINLVWEGTNITGRRNHAPRDIYDPYSPGLNNSGTFHPSGRYVPPPGFDYVRDPERADFFVLLGDDRGRIAADVREIENFGVYCPNWPNILARERAALVDLGSWIERTNRDGEVIVSLQLQNEIRVVVEREPEIVQLERCRCSLSDYLFENRDQVPEGFGDDAPTFAQFLARYPALTERVTEEEAFNQWSFQLYFRQLIRAVRSAAPGLPIVVSSFGEDVASTPETDNPGSPIHHVPGWVDNGVDIVGPDMFGFRDDPFQREFAVPGNALWPPEFGAQSEPYFQIFGLLGRNVATGVPSFTGVGSQSYALYGDLIGLFWALVSDGISRSAVPNAPLGTWYGDPPGNRLYRGAFYTRNSFHALRSAETPVAKLAGTDRMFAFYDRVYLPEEENFSGGVWSAGGVDVRIDDLGGRESPARGAVLRTAERDFTVLGTSFRAEIRVPPFPGEQMRVERGFWRGERWVRTAGALAGSVSRGADGHVTVTMSRDETSTEGPVSPGSGGPLDLQYAVRVFSAPPGGPVDTDRDGVPEGVDLCPSTPDPAQGDADGDGVGDACDLGLAAVAPPPEEPTPGEEPPPEPGPAPSPTPGARGGGGGGCRVAADASAAPWSVGGLVGAAWLVSVARRRRRA